MKFKERRLKQQLQFVVSQSMNLHSWFLVIKNIHDLVELSDQCGPSELTEVCHQGVAIIERPIKWQDVFKR